MSTGLPPPGQPEGLCLRYPENLGLQREVTYEMATNMLLRATSMAQTVPFTWGYLDKMQGVKGHSLFKYNLTHMF
jgi:hypothetical protein